MILPGVLTPTSSKPQQAPVATSNSTNQSKTNKVTQPFQLATCGNLFPSYFHHPDAKKPEFREIRIQHKNELEEKIKEDPTSIEFRANLVDKYLFLAGSSESEEEKSSCIKAAKEHLKAAFKLNYFNSEVHEKLYHMQLFNGIHFDNLKELGEATSKLRRSLALNPNNEAAKKSYEVFTKNVSAKWAKELKDGQLEKNVHDQQVKEFISILRRNPFETEKDIPFDHFKLAPEEFQKSHPYLASKETFSAKFAPVPKINEFQIINSNGESYISKSTAQMLEKSEGIDLPFLKDKSGKITVFSMPDKDFKELAAIAPNITTIKI